MAKGSKKPAMPPKGASRAQTQEYLYKLFKQGHPPAMALEMLKSAGVAGEAMRSSAAARSQAFASSDAAQRLDRLLRPFTDAAWRLDDD